MTYFLRKGCAFASKKFNAIINKIETAYLYAGYMAWRLTSDDRFLSLSLGEDSQYLVKKAVPVVNMGKKMVQTKIAKDVENTIRLSNYGPQPSLKPGLIALAKALTPYFTGVGWTRPITASLMAVAFGMAAYGYAQTLSSNAVGQNIAALSSYQSQPSQRPKDPDVA